jgi:hypothetical protein
VNQKNILCYHAGNILVRGKAINPGEIHAEKTKKGQIFNCIMHEDFAPSALTIVDCDVILADHGALRPDSSPYGR